MANSNPSTEDPFDTLLTLEDTLYTTAYAAGVRDGAQSGRIEGRIFGLEKGFEKFATMGALHGRACVWGSRIPSFRTQTKEAEPSTVHVKKDQESQDVAEKLEEPASISLPPLLHLSTRLTKNIMSLHSLTDPLTFSTLNTEDGVADFDDRVKRAGAKAKIIERTLGETDASASSEGGAKKGARGVKVAGEKKGEDNMEDFKMGGRLLG